MNGLEQILQKIEEENQAAVSQIISDAEASAKKQIEEEKIKAFEQAKSITDDARKNAALIEENAESGYLSVIRKGQLKAKADIVSEWINNAMSDIGKMDSEEYFSTLFNLILSHSDKKSGLLLLNKKDKESMPPDFMKMLNDALEDDESLTLAKEDADIENGCIIRYGGIEENCTFSALLDEKADEVKDKLFALVNS